MLLITTVKKLSSYDLSSIFCEFSNLAKFAPLWFTAESQGKLGPSKVVTSAGESNTPSLSCLMTSFEGLKLFRWLIFELRSFEPRNFTNCRFVAPSARKLRIWFPSRCHNLTRAQFPLGLGGEPKWREFCEVWKFTKNRRQVVWR